jgi:hypothetical protein
MLNFIEVVGIIDKPYKKVISYFPLKLHKLKYVL